MEEGYSAAFPDMGALRLDRRVAEVQRPGQRCTGVCDSGQAFPSPFRENAPKTFKRFSGFFIGGMRACQVRDLLCLERILFGAFL
jgi:hypothetical protein